MKIGRPDKIVNMKQINKTDKFFTSSPQTPPTGYEKTTGEHIPTTPPVDAPGYKKLNSPQYSFYLGSDTNSEVINDLICAFIEIQNAYTDPSINTDHLTVKIYMNNPRNIDFHDMASLVNLITACPLKVYTFCLSCVDGNAFTLFMAGDYRSCYSYSMFRYSVDYSLDEKYEENNDYVLALADDMITGQTDEETVSTLIDNEGKYLYSDEAEELGIVHEIIMMSKMMQN